MTQMTFSELPKCNAYPYRFELQSRDVDYLLRIEAEIRQWGEDNKIHRFWVNAVRIPGFSTSDRVTVFLHRDEDAMMFKLRFL
jgi:hypothetical protein